GRSVGPPVARRGECARHDTRLRVLCQARATPGGGGRARRAPPCGGRLAAPCLLCSGRPPGRRPPDGTHRPGQEGQARPAPLPPAPRNPPQLPPPPPPAHPPPPP